MKHAIKTSPKNKSPGTDGITTEAILASGEIGITSSWLTSIFQKAWNERKVPDDWQRAVIVPISSSRSSDGNSSLLNEDGSASQVPQASVELAGYGSVVWPDSLSEWLVDGAGLQYMFCCLAASTARALLCMANAEFGI